MFEHMRRRGFRSNTNGSTTSLASTNSGFSTTSFSSISSTNSVSSAGNTQARMCPSCDRPHITQTVEGRYILADHLDKYMELRFGNYTCKVKRESKMSKHVIVVPEKLHEKELNYLQQATARGGLKPGYLVPLPGHVRKADTAPARIENGL